MSTRSWAVGTGSLSAVALTLALLLPGQFQEAPAGQLRGGGTGGVAGSVGCPEDINQDGDVDVDDLVALILAWGPCSSGCTSSAECDDGDPCTTDVCNMGTCEYTPLPNCCQTSGDCPTVPNATTMCISGQCVLVCDSGYLDCDGNLATGCEVSILDDDNNCGGCGLACPPGSTCVGGSCVVE